MHTYTYTLHQLFYVISMIIEKSNNEDFALTINKVL